MNKCENCNKCNRTTHRTEEEKKKLTKRLNIIEGQLKGIRQMLEDDRYCQDIVIQISAVDKSLKSLGNEILKSHLSSCVVADIKNNNLEVIDEVVSLAIPFTAKKIARQTLFSWWKSSNTILDGTLCKRIGSFIILPRTWQYKS